jgi:hypothetical protein
MKITIIRADILHLTPDAPYNEYDMPDAIAQQFIDRGSAEVKIESKKKGAKGEAP